MENLGSCSFVNTVQGSQNLAHTINTLWKLVSKWCPCAFVFTHLICPQNLATEIVQFIHHPVKITPWLRSKDENVLIKRLYEQKGYNTGQFMMEFTVKRWTKCRVKRLLLKSRKCYSRRMPVRLSGALPALMTGLTLLNRWYWAVTSS